MPHLPQFRHPCVHCIQYTAVVVASVPHTLKYNDDTGHAYDAKGMCSTSTGKDIKDWTFYLRVFSN